ncbi:MAG: NAD(P)H-dependent oxidoreductase subunit E [Chloroflexia bacterium]
MLSEPTRQLIVAESIRYPQRRSALLPALQLAQDEAGWLSRETMEEVASLLETDPNALYDLATFYSLLHTEPVGRYVVRVCNGLSCYIKGRSSSRTYLPPGGRGAVRHELRRPLDRRAVRVPRGLRRRARPHGERRPIQKHERRSG